MAVNLSPYGGVGAQFLDNSGNVLTGGKIFTYSAGTTTNQVTYTTSAGNIPHSNPIILDASGRVPSGGEIWLTDGLAYKFILRDANDVLIATYDNVIGINSNFVNFTNEQEIQTATAGQTVFNLTTTTYSPATNSLSVFVDGVNQYGPGAQYAYVETDSDTVTFVNGLHVGALVKFTTSQLNASSGGDAFQISYTPPFTGSVGTNVGDKLAQYISVKDFGAVGDGVTDDTVAIQAAVSYVGSIGGAIFFPTGSYLVSSTINILDSGIVFAGESAVGTFEGSKIIGNVATPAAIFSIGNFVEHILFTNIAIESAPIGIIVPIGSLVTDLSFNYVVFSHISDKAIFIADTSDGLSGGLIVANISNVQYNDCKSGFVSATDCMVNNVHFDNQWWYNPQNGGYGVYLGDSLYTTNNSIKDSLFNGKPGTTALPFSFGKFNNITIDNVQTADFTQVNGVTDNIPIIELRANIIPNSVLKISGLFTVNPRGPIIDNLSTVGMGNISIENCDFTAGFSNQIITNINKIARISVVNSRLTAPTRTGNNSSMQWVNNTDGNFTTQPLNTFPTAASTNLTMNPADVGSHYMFTTGASNLTVALPVITSFPLGGTVTVSKQDSGVGTITLNRNSSDTVGGPGSFSYVLSGQYNSVTLISDGINNWYVQT